MTLRELGLGFAAIVSDPKKWQARLPIERSNCSCSGATCQKPGRKAWHSHGNSPRKIIACCSQTGEPNILRPQILSCQPHKVELSSSIKPERAVPEYLRLVVSPILRLPNIFAAGDFLCSFLLRPTTGLPRLNPQP